VIPSSAKIFLFSTASRLTPGLTQPPTQWPQGALSPGGKEQEHEADKSSTSNAKVKKGAAIPPLSHMSLWHSAHLIVWFTSENTVNITHYTFWFKTKCNSVLWRATILQSSSKTKGIVGINIFGRKCNQSKLLYKNLVLFMNWRMPFSGMWHHVVLVWTDISEEHITSIFRVEKSTSEEPAWAGGCRLSASQKQPAM
jgi:hypothetical protein